MSEQPGTPIEELDLSVAAYNILKREGIRTAEQLAERSREDLLDLRNFGAGRIAEVEAVLAERGLKLAVESAWYDMNPRRAAAVAAYLRALPDHELYNLAAELPPHWWRGTAIDLLTDRAG
jgi:hypothetical protein